MTTSSSPTPEKIPQVTPQGAAQASDGSRPPLPTREEIAKLPPDGGPTFNRLVFQASPYLLQHARNPVDWYPWGSEAFEHAARENKPIFLSIGYSTCHWCHVMEHECFEDEEVAKLMNEFFVCIKVDREERPDVDEIYMTITQAMTGSGGWPMTVVLTPEREPFFAATYIPKHARGGSMGMLELLPALAKSWREDRENVVASAQRATQWLKQRTRTESGGAIAGDVQDRAQQMLAGKFDAQWGGFGTAPKFPTPHNLRFLLRRALRSDDPAAKDMVVSTLTHMRAGGIWDQLGFGFHRYSTDREWLLPHFEKMLYDNALVALACIEGWQASGEIELRRTAEAIFAYVLRDMRSTEGGFFSAEDADSAGEEGLFYTWTPEELSAVLGQEDGALAAELWDVRPGGNFRDQATGKSDGRSILHLPKSVRAFAKEKGMEPAALETRIESMRARLFAEREKRIHPYKDEKILCDWNGLMIAALSYAGRAMNEPEYVDAARRAAEFVLAKLRTEQGELLKSWRDGRVSGSGVLDDYAFFTWGLIELHQATGEPRWLELALELVELEHQLFWDEAAGGFFLSSKDTEHLITRPKTFYDGALPSGNSVSALNLLRLARLTGRTELEERAARTFQAASSSINASPSAHTQFLLAVDFNQGPSIELVIAGDSGAEDYKSGLEQVRRVFSPNCVILARPEGELGARIAALAPYAALQVARDGKLTLYLCRNFACEQPTHDLERILAALR